MEEALTGVGLGGQSLASSLRLPASILPGVVLQGAWALSLPADEMRPQIARRLSSQATGSESQLHHLLAVWLWHMKLLNVSVSLFPHP